MPQQASSKPLEKGIAASDGSAFPMILEHYMLNQSSYEIPLRSMYTLNCQMLPMMSTSGFKDSSAKPAAAAAAATQNSADPMADAASQFKAQLISHISKSSHQSPLPVGFMVSFVRRTFAPNLEEVDFPQAVAALEYLANLHKRRHKEARAALESLAIKVDLKAGFIRICPYQMEELRETYPGVVRWVESIEKRDRSAYHYYRFVSLALRRWTLLNEMWLEPLNKGNCIAMLNTLFPPPLDNDYTTASYNGELKPDELAKDRAFFLDQIRNFGRTGKSGLEYVLKHGARPGDETGWPSCHEKLQKYLDLATEMIHDCEGVKGRAELNGRDCLETELRKTHKRSADSGVSFTSSIRHDSVSSSNDSRAGTPLDKSRSPTPEGKHGKSTLERISHTLRKMRSRPDISSISNSNKEPGKPKTLSKKKSLTALVSGRSTSSSSGHEPFDVHEMNRKKMIWEANERKKAALQAAEPGRASSKELYDE